MPTIYVNAHQIKKVQEKFSSYNQTHVNAHLIFLFGMENIVSNAHLELNSIQKNINAITAQTDLEEIVPVTLVSQDLCEIHNDSLWFAVFIILFSFQ
jgi:hypothetical protein